MTAVWSLARGASVGAEGVHFSLWAPNATKGVAVRLEEGQTYPLEPRDGGVYEATVRDAHGGTDYRYVLDGGRVVPDPVSRFQPQGVHGPSRVVDPAAYRWRDAAWRGIEMRDAVIYELHVGTFSDEGTFAGVIPHLSGLRDLGITAIEIMPVAEFPGARNWGYDGVLLYAAQSSYGGPERLRQLVDAAHEMGLAVILDVVYNHVGPEGNYLESFGPYFTRKYTTPWGPALNYDDAGSDDVRRFIAENALFWVTEYHVDGLRLDAVHGIFDFSPRHILRDIAESVHAQASALGRHAIVIAESDLNDPRIVNTPDACGYGLDSQWADDLHHAIHSALTGERSGYYADFGGVTPVATALRTPFVYDGRYSTHRNRRHGAPATGIPTDRFVACIQNHDQVGNRAAGDRLAALIGLRKSRLAAALLLLSPYVPLLFMGEEYGETNPFQYFVSHGDPTLIEAVREGRRKEFEAFGWGDDVPDPQSDETFARSRLDRRRASQGEHRGMLALYRDLLRLRSAEPALRPGSTAARIAHDERSAWITLALTGESGRPLVAVFNISDRDQDVPMPSQPSGEWTLLLSTEATDYCGSGGAAERVGMETGSAGRVKVPAWSASVYSTEDGR
ncbi:MAG: malto-oligosyltrehalose trehalohydrolase [Gemmatimonadaceae bacterium]